MFMVIYKIYIYFVSIRIHVYKQKQLNSNYKIKNFLSENNWYDFILYLLYNSTNK